MDDSTGNSFLDFSLFFLGFVLNLDHMAFLYRSLGLLTFLQKLRPQIGNVEGLKIGFNPFYHLRVGRPPPIFCKALVYLRKVEDGDVTLSAFFIVVSTSSIRPETLVSNPPTCSFRATFSFLAMFRGLNDKFLVGVRCLHSLC